jgi:YjbE family integral membrane protein
MLAELDSARFWFDLLQIIGINILLSGDNAVVIALASRSLPKSQRKMAVLGGSGAAVVLRIALCLIVASLLQIRYLKLVGGLLLLYIGIKLIVEEESNDEIAARSNMWGAIRTILIADAVMSLDNVVAIAAAAHDSVLLIALGLLISIPLIVFGSQLMLKVLHRYPVLVMLGGGLLGWIAGEIIVSDPVVHGHLPFDEELVMRIAKPLLAIGVMLAGTALARRAAADPIEP